MTVLVPFMLCACAAQRPVLYPNEHLRSVGETAAQRDVDDCVQLATESGVESASRGGDAAKSGAVGATIGAATGAVVGAIFGNAGRGAATGAVGGGVSAGLATLFYAGKPDPLTRQFVNRCLNEKGYDPIGWD